MRSLGSVTTLLNLAFTKVVVAKNKIFLVISGDWKIGEYKIRNNFTLQGLILFARMGLLEEFRLT